MNLTDTFLLVILILLAIMLIWMWITLALWISKRLRIPVLAVLAISIFTGGLGFIVLLILALMKEDDELRDEDRRMMEIEKTIEKIESNKENEKTKSKQKSKQ